MFGKTLAQVKSGLPPLQGCTVHNGFELAFLILEIAHVLKITRHGIERPEQRAFRGRFLLGRANQSVFHDRRNDVVKVAG